MLDGPANRERQKNAAGTQVRRQISPSPRLIRVHLAGPDHAVKSGGRFVAAAQDQQLQRAAFGQGAHHPIVKAKKQRRTEDTRLIGAGPTLVMQAHQDALAYFQISAARDTFQFGCSLRPFVKGPERTFQVAPTVGRQAAQIRIPGRGQADVRSAGHDGRLGTVAGSAKRLDEPIGHCRVAGHHRQDDFVPASESAAGNRFDETMRHFLFGAALGEDGKVIGIDAVLRRLARREEFEAPKRQPAAIPVPAPQHGRQADETLALMEKTQAKLPAVQAAKDAPPRQKPIGRLRQFIAFAALEQFAPGGPNRFGLGDVGRHGALERSCRGRQHARGADVHRHD